MATRMISYHPLQDSGSLPRTVYSFRPATAPLSPPLKGEKRADLAVIGGGITGLSAALHAAEEGASVIVLEANEVGWGASGRNFGQVVPYLRHEPNEVLRALGQERGRRVLRAGRDGAELVFSLIERHGIDCEARRGGLVFAAHTPDKLRKLQRRHAFWKAEGEAPDLLEGDEITDVIGGGGYWGGLLEHRGGTINALSYTRGLAHAAIGAGASVHGRSRVGSLTRNEAGWRVSTVGGSVVADTVLLCTNAYSDAICRSVARSVIPLRAYQVFSRPLSENVRETVLPRANALTDTRRLMSGVRRHADGRLHVSGPISAFGPEGKPSIDSLSRRLLRQFPQIESLEWEGSWSGWVAMTPDEYPRLLDVAPGLMAGVGYSGRGLSLATYMGRELARRAGGAASDDATFLPVAPRALPFATVTRAMAKGLSELYRVQDHLDDLRYGQRRSKGEREARR